MAYCEVKECHNLSRDNKELSHKANDHIFGKEASKTSHPSISGSP